MALKSTGQGSTIIRETLLQLVSLKSGLKDFAGQRAFTTRRVPSINRKRCLFLGGHSLRTHSLTSKRCLQKQKDSFPLMIKKRQEGGEGVFLPLGGCSWDVRLGKQRLSSCVSTPTLSWAGTFVLCTKCATIHSSLILLFSWLWSCTCWIIFPASTIPSRKALLFWVTATMWLSISLLPILCYLTLLSKPSG